MKTLTNKISMAFRQGDAMSPKLLALAMEQITGITINLKFFKILYKAEDVLLSSEKFTKREKCCKNRKVILQHQLSTGKILENYIINIPIKHKRRVF